MWFRLCEAPGGIRLTEMMEHSGQGLGEDPGLDFNADRVSVWEDENVLEMVVGGPCNNVNVFTAPNWTPKG